MVYFKIEDSRLLEYGLNQSKYTNLPDGSYSKQRILEQIHDECVINLHVTQSGGFNVTPDYNLVVTDLNASSDGFIYKKFYNRGFGGITFKITIIIKKDEVWSSPLYGAYKGVDSTEFNILTVLKELMRKVVPVKVVTDAIDIPNKTYIITKNPSRKQTSEGYTVWELEFTTYDPLIETRYANDNTRVKKAIQSAKAKNVTVKTSSSKGKSTKTSSLKKCNRSVLVYSRKQKKVTCVVYLQEILKKLKCYSGKVDGWFGPLTTTGVKNFQRKYKKKYSLKITGTVNQKTYNAIISVSSGA